MFRANTMHTGVSSCNISSRPSLLWLAEVGQIVASPVYSNKVLYAPSMMGMLFALNAKEKDVLWHLDIGSPLISSPLIYNDLLITATFDTWVKDTRFLGTNFVFGINVKEGKTKWRFKINGDIFSSPCAYGNMCVIGSLDNNVYAISMNEGELQWKYQTEGAVWSSPALNDDTIIVGSDDGNLYALDFGSLKWKTKLNGMIRSSSPSLSAENVFIGTYNGSMYALNVDSGKINWEMQAAAHVLSSPGLVNEKVLFASSDHKVYCLNVRDGKKIWDFECDDAIWSSPALQRMQRS